ncbi:MAG TPA: VanZ family protein [Candidatus Pullichristensenella avicola]|nr:VanZ family protein [Candidatus Pullichristensenella avicola]
MSHLAEYIGPISTAVWVFPFVAMVFTIPYVVSRYHKYGAVLFLRTLLVYSFIFYLLCVYFLGVLPLPSVAEVSRMTGDWAQLTPFRGLRNALAEARFEPGEAASWLRVLSTDNFFYLAANVAMLFPLGIYLRYYFRQNFLQTARWGFLVSLSIELLQLTGLFFIYPRPYRLFDVDDLIANTLGAALGYLVAPLPMKILPSQERLDRIAYRRGERVSIMRAAVAAGIDWGACALVAAPVSGALGVRGGGRILTLYVACVLVYFIVVQYLARGRTLGKALCRVRLVREDGGRPRLWQVAVRCVSLYLVLLAAPYAGFCAWNAMIDATGWRFFALGAAAVVCLGLFTAFVFSCFVNMLTRASRLPHERLSRTRNQSTVRPEPPAGDGE